MAWRERTLTGDPDLRAGPVSVPDLRIIGAAVVALVALDGVLVWGWLKLCGTAPGLADMAICAAPVLLSIALAATSRDDRRQYVARLFAAAVMPPVLLWMWASSEPVRDVAPLSGGMMIASAAGVALLQLLGRAGLFFSVARYSTRIGPQAGVRVLSAAQLMNRLRSLSVSGALFSMQAGPDARSWDLHLAVGSNATRSHRVRLSLDEAGHEVQVIEDLGVSGASPQSAAEADMRAAGETQWDPTRPEAGSIYSRVRQTTLIEPGRLASMPDAWDDPSISAWIDHLPDDGSEARGEALVTLLAALFTQSGWTWQPAMLADSQAGAEGSIAA